MEPIKLYVGCSPNGLDAESMMVLEYSIDKNTTGPVDITYMHPTVEGDSPWDGWNTSTWATPFSGYRWAVPWVEDVADRAIYCDSDFIFLEDLRKLWETEFKQGNAVVAKGAGHGWRYCSALWNVEEARNHILPLDRLKVLPNAHQRMMQYFSYNLDIVQSFNGNWNCIDGENQLLDQEFENDTQLELAWRDIACGLHYSDMCSQLHHKYAFPRIEKEKKKVVNGVQTNHWFDGALYEHPNKNLQRLFDMYYNAAISDGYEVSSYVPEEKDWVEITKQPQTNYGVTFKAHEFSGGA